MDELSVVRRLNTIAKGLQAQGSTASAIKINDIALETRETLDRLHRRIEAQLQLLEVAGARIEDLENELIEQCELNDLEQE